MCWLIEKHTDHKDYKKLIIMRQCYKSQTTMGSVTVCVEVGSLGSGQELDAGVNKDVLSYQRNNIQRWVRSVGQRLCAGSVLFILYHHALRHASLIRGITYPRLVT